MSALVAGTGVATTADTMPPRPLRMAAVACGGWSAALYPKWTPTQVSPSPQVEQVGELQSLSSTHCWLVVTEQFPGMAPGCPQSKIHRPMPTIRSPVPAQAHAGYAPASHSKWSWRSSLPVASRSASAASRATKWFTSARTWVAGKSALGWSTENRGVPDFSLARRACTAVESGAEEGRVMIRMPAAAAAAALVSLLALAPGARADTSIAAIVDHPDDYANQQVTVVATVAAPSLGYLGESLYTLFGDQRRINVVSHSPAPAIGDRLEVTAKVGRRPPDEEFDFPPVLIENVRQPAP